MNLAELEKMRDAFKSSCTDFVDFQQTDGFYFNHERGGDYKNALISKAKDILDGPDGDKPEKVGLKFLELVEGIKNGGFVNFRAFDAIKKGGAKAKHEVSLALGEMLLSTDAPAVAAANAARRIHPFVSGFSLVRSLVSSVLALAKPSEAIAIKTRYLQKAARKLTGKPLFSSGVMTADEYQALLDLAFEIQTVLKEWDWKPQDLWDVQGFLWVVADYPPPPSPPPPPETDVNPVADQPMGDPPALNLILYGPPGTGKTWATARKAVEICTGIGQSDLVDDRQKVMAAYKELVTAGRVVFTTFHQSIGYEEFVEGLRPVTNAAGQPSAGFRLEPYKGIFRRICESAESSPGVPFVLIIDEINRANVSKVLGELITLLEPDKRLRELNALTVTLPYSRETFGVPNNLYVIGTMNTADRSIALLDTALRRRFEFEEMMPDYTRLDRLVEDIHLGNLLKAINRRVEWLFDRDHQIGHSYLIDVKTTDDLDEVMRGKIIPLLAEYFYEDWEKVRAALNDQKKDGCFVIRKKLPSPPGFQSEEERWRYEINEDEFIDGYEAAAEQV
jgi:hypothetical protein